MITDFIYQLCLTYMSIPIWDFLCFYLFGNVGISGSNFYDPHVFLQIYNDLNLQNKGDGGFISEIVNVGFWYPPPSMFLFLPLGAFDLKTGYIIWQTMIIVFFISDILLLIKYNSFDTSPIHTKKLFYLLFISSILLFPNLLSSIQISQTVSIFLLFLILLINYLNSWKSGVFLAFLIILKPLAAIFGLYFLFFRKWKPLASLLITGSILMIITALYFGYSPFLEYLTSPPTKRIPVEVFYESTNQSLHAVILRLQLKLSGYINFNIIKIATYVISILIILITLYSSRIIARKSKKLSFMIFIPMALLVYPNTLNSYTIILIPVILYFFDQKLFANGVANLILILFFYCIGNYSFFLFNLVLWGILVLLSMSDKHYYCQKIWPEKLNWLLFQNKNQNTLLEHK